VGLVAPYTNSRVWDALGPLAADHIKDVIFPYQYAPLQFSRSFSQAKSRRLEMGIIVSCLAGIVTCIGECLMGIIGAIVDCLECVISGAPTLRLPRHTADGGRAAIFGLFTGIVDCICDCLCCG